MDKDKNLYISEVSDTDHRVGINLPCTDGCPPEKTLDVRGQGMFSGNVWIWGENSGYWLDVRDNYGYGMARATDNRLYFRTAGAERLTISSGGNVGIGTASPAYNLHTIGTSYASSDTRAPIFYDSNDTGYYINPNSGSQVSTIYANNWFRAQGATGLYFQDYGGGWYMTDSTWIRAYNNKPVYSPGEIQSGNNMRAPIFYDANDSYYRVDPNGSSYLHYLYANDIISSTKFISISNKGCPSGWYCTVYGWDGSFQSIAYWGSLYYASSIQFKKDLHPYTGNLLDKVSKLQPYLYHFKTESGKDQKHFGYIVEDLPKEVTVNGKFVDSNSYQGMLLRLIQELNEKIEKEESRNNLLEGKIEQLEKQSFSAGIK
jgi:hypothetical protein